MARERVRARAKERVAEVQTAREAREARVAAREVRNKLAGMFGDTERSESGCQWVLGKIIGSALMMLVASFMLC